MEKRTEQAGGTVRIAVKITDTGGGIGGRLEWFVKNQSSPEGHLQGRVYPEELKKGLAAETLTIDPRHLNVVEVTAYNGKEMIATPPLPVTVDAFGAPTEERALMYVLAIGVDKYRMKDYGLHYAAEDAESFAKALQVVGSELFAKVVSTLLQNEEVTPAAIGNAFERIDAVAKPSDVFILFLGGHGKSIGGKYYYYPQALDFAHGGRLEQDGIGIDQWQAWLAKVGHVEKTLLIIDTCESVAAAGFIRGGESARQTAMDQLLHATGQNLTTPATQPRTKCRHRPR